MLAQERRGKIIEITKKLGSVEVDMLAQNLNVSTMTIRRDLSQLEKEGLLKRTHGGAIARDEIIYSEKKSSHRDAKISIAKKASSYIKEGDCIFVDAGTTTYELAKYIKKMERLTVVTTDLEIALLLKNSNNQVYICGGKVQNSTGSMSDSYTLQMIQNFYFDLGFFGAACINSEFIVMTPTTDKSWLKRLVVEHCKHSYLLVDDSKFHREAVTKINALEDYTGVITDKVFSQEELQLVRKREISLISMEKKS